MFVIQSSSRSAMRKLVALVAMTFLIPSFAFAQVTTDDIGLTETAKEAGYDVDEERTEIGTYIGARIIKPLFALIGIIFLILIIYGGLLWMTGGGNTETIQKAKRVLVNSILGIFIILLAYGFTLFLFQSIVGGAAAATL